MKASEREPQTLTEGAPQPRVSQAATRQASRSDEQLARLAAVGDEQAFNELARRFHGMLATLASRRYALGHGQDDLRQEALIALYAAVCSYDQTTEVPFGRFAHLVVTRRLDSFVIYANRKKHAHLTESVSFNLVISAEDESVRLEDMLDEPGSDPFDRLVERERLGAVVTVISSGLSPLQRDVATRWVNGAAYRGDKSFDNALQRVRRKVAAALRELEEAA